MRFRLVAVLAFVMLGAAPPARAGESFARGHIFVAVTEPESCDFGGREWIIEVDPVSGAWSVFADSDDGLCGVTGLRFTPDGTRLLAASFGHIIKSFDGGWIQAFSPDGRSEIILDASDGLFGPNGSNCLAFDEGGDLYVVSTQNSTILRFPHSGGPATVFADYTDGIDDRGALDFAPNGDLFYTGDLAQVMLRIAPTGDATVFRPQGATAMSIDRHGNLYVSGARAVYALHVDDPQFQRVVASGFGGADTVVPTPFGDQRYLFTGGYPGQVHRIDRTDGTVVLMSDFSEVSPLNIFARGIAVFAPVLAGDSDQDRDTDLADLASLQRCWAPEGGVDPSGPCKRSDVDNNGTIDFTDLAMFVLGLTGP